MTVLFLFTLCVPVLTVPPALLQLAAATSQVAALQDERELQAGVVSDLERILARIERASAGPARPGGSKAAVAGGSLAAVSKQLVQAKLAEADAQRKLRVSAQDSTKTDGRAATLGVCLTFLVQKHQAQCTSLRDFQVVQAHHVRPLLEIRPFDCVLMWPWRLVR